MLLLRKSLLHLILVLTPAAFGDGSELPPMNCIARVLASAGVHSYFTARESVLAEEFDANWARFFFHSPLEKHRHAVLAALQTWENPEERAALLRRAFSSPYEDLSQGALLQMAAIPGFEVTPPMQSKLSDYLANNHNAVAQQAAIALCRGKGDPYSLRAVSDWFGLEGYNRYLTFYSTEPTEVYALRSRLLEALEERTDLAQVDFLDGLLRTQAMSALGGYPLDFYRRILDLLLRAKSVSPDLDRAVSERVARSVQNSLWISSVLDMVSPRERERINPLIDGLYEKLIEKHCR